MLWSNRPQIKLFEAHVRHKGWIFEENSGRGHLETIHFEMFWRPTLNMLNLENNQCFDRIVRKSNYLKLMCDTKVGYLRKIVVVVT